MPDELPPLVPPTPTQTPLTPGEPAVVGVGLTPNVAGGIAAVLPLLGGIIMLVLEKRDQFVRFCAMQSVFFGGAWFVYGIVSAVIEVVLSSIFAPLGWLWHLFSALAELGFVVVWIIFIIQSFNGKVWEMPVLGKLARQQLSKTPPAL